MDVSDRGEQPEIIQKRDIMCQSMINFKPKTGPAIEVFKMRDLSIPEAPSDFQKNTKETPYGIKPMRSKEVAKSMVFLKSSQGARFSKSNVSNSDIYSMSAKKNSLVL